MSDVNMRITLERDENGWRTGVEQAPNAPPPDLRMIGLQLVNTGVAILNQIAAAEDEAEEAGEGTRAVPPPKPGLILPPSARPGSPGLVVPR